MTLVVPHSAAWTREPRDTREMDPEIHSTASTPTPPMPGSTSRDSDSIVKDENGQDIVCVVCSDKSSGRHYGQFTCEGEL